MSYLQDLLPKAILLPTCAFFSRSVIAGNQPGVCLSSSKVMITKANVEPLNCTSWWQAIQCCSCLVKSATWREGFLWGSVGGRWGQLDITMAWNCREDKVYIYIYTHIWKEKQTEVSEDYMFSCHHSKVQMNFISYQKTWRLPPPFFFCVCVFCVCTCQSLNCFFEMIMNVWGLCFLTISEVCTLSRLLSRRFNSGQQLQI